MSFAGQLIGRAHRVGRQPEGEAIGVDVDDNLVAPWTSSRYSGSAYEHQVQT